MGWVPVGRRACLGLDGTKDAKRGILASAPTAYPRIRTGIAERRSQTPDNKKPGKLVSDPGSRQRKALLTKILVVVQRPKLWKKSLIINGVKHEHRAYTLLRTPKNRSASTSRCSHLPRDSNRRSSTARWVTTLPGSGWRQSLPVAPLWV